MKSKGFKIFQYIFMEVQETIIQIINASLEKVKESDDYVVRDLTREDIAQISQTFARYCNKEMLLKISEVMKRYWYILFTSDIGSGEIFFTKIVIILTKISLDLAQNPSKKMQSALFWVNHAIQDIIEGHDSISEFAETWNNSKEWTDEDCRIGWDALFENDTTLYDAVLNTTDWKNLKPLDMDAASQSPSGSMTQQRDGDRSKRSGSQHSSSRGSTGSSNKGSGAMKIDSRHGSEHDGPPVSPGDRSKRSGSQHSSGRGSTGGSSKGSGAMKIDSPHGSVHGASPVKGGDASDDDDGSLLGPIAGKRSLPFDAQDMESQKYAKVSTPGIWGDLSELDGSGNYFWNAMEYEIDRHMILAMERSMAEALQKWIRKDNTNPPDDFINSLIRVAYQQAEQILSTHGLDVSYLDLVYQHIQEHKSYILGKLHDGWGGGKLNEILYYGILDTLLEPTQGTHQEEYTTLRNDLQRLIWDVANHENIREIVEGELSGYFDNPGFYGLHYLMT